MATRLIDVYPSDQVNPGGVDYPGGSGKNVSAPGGGDGTPFDETWFNDIQGFLASLLVRAGFTANGNVETATASQYTDAVEAVSLAAAQAPVKTPINLTPANNAVIGTTTPTLIANAFQSLYGRAHSASEFRIGTSTSGNDVTDIVGFSGTLGAVLQWLVSPSLATGDDYFWQARYQDEDGVFSNWSIPFRAVLPTLSVQTPTNLLPVDLDTTVTDVETFTADAFVRIPPGGEDHVASQWQITTDVSFATIDFDSGEDAINLTSFTQAGLALGNITYFWRVRYKDGTFGFSDFSPVFSFTTVVEAVQQPNNVTPSNGTTDVGISVQLTADSFTPIGSAQTHTASQWQVGNSDFSTIFFDSGVDAVNLETINATGYPEGTTTVFWRVRYQGSITGFSEFSTPFTFVTVATFADWLNWTGQAGAKLTSSTLLTTGGIFSRNLDVAIVDTDKALIAFVEATSFDVVAQIITVSGLVATKPGSSEAQGTGIDAQAMEVHKVATDKAIYMIQGLSPSSTIRVGIITVSGDTPTVESVTTAASDASTSSSADATLVVLDSLRTALLYTDTSGDMVCRIIDTTGTTVTFGTPVVFNHTNLLNNVAATFLETDKIVLVSFDATTTFIYLQIVDIAASVPTFGTPVTTSKTASVTNLAIVRTDVGEFTYYIGGPTSESGRATYSGSTISVGTKVTTATDLSGDVMKAVIPVDGQVMVHAGNTGTPDFVRTLAHDPVTPVFKAPVDQTPVDFGGISNIAVLDADRLALVYMESIAVQKIVILDGS